MSKAVTKTPGKRLSWEDLCRDPQLQDLPYKIELNERGQIIMSPTQQKHGARQAEIVRLFTKGQSEGRAVTECAIRTSKGTKVTDVGWYTTARWEEVKDTFDTPTAPEICVEVVSPYNTQEELDEKKHLYFEAGAEEVWFCDEEGALHFYDAQGAREHSARAPDFPADIEL